MATIDELSRKFALLKELREYHEHMAETLGSELSQLGPLLFKAFGDASSDQFRVSGELFKDGSPRIITPTLKYKPSVLKESELFSWLRSHDSGSIIRETVHHKTLESLIEKLKEENLELPPPDVLTVFTIETCSLRRAPKQK
jgi:hypothetical protein